MRKSILLTWILLQLITVHAFVSAQTLEASLSGTDPDDRFGSDVSMSDDGTTVVIGAPFADVNGCYCGYARIFKHDGSNWVQYGPSIPGDTNADTFGYAVSVSADGTRAAISSPSSDAGPFNNTGLVRIYDLTDTSWVQWGADLTGSNNYMMGAAVALDSTGHRLVMSLAGISCPGGGSDCGEVRVYEDSSGTWVKVGNSIYGESPNDVFGGALAISSDGNRIAGGSTSNSANGLMAGHVRVFDLIAGTWTQVGSDIDGESAYSQSGRSISLSSDGNRIAIGAFGNSNGAGNAAGQVRVFDLVGGAWVQVGPDIDGLAAGEAFGNELSMLPDGSRLAVGGPGYFNYAGRTKLFEYNGTNWIQIGNTLGGSGRSGHALDMSADGTRLAVATPFEDTFNGTDIGVVRFFEVLLFSGAEELNSENSDIYPNPFHNQLHVTIRTSDHATIFLSDLGSRLLLEKKLVGSDVVEIGHLANGLYFYELRNDAGEVFSKGKLIKN